ncbi:MAG: AAA family ATPase [Desulfuromonadales bacterium]
MVQTDLLVKQQTGMVLGKFLPPTRGHRYLIDFARAWCVDLTVIIGSLEREPIPGEVRAAWLREMFPDVTVLHLTDELPQFPHEHPDFWQIWHDSIRRLLPSGPDLVFASEEYGFRLAEILGARYVPVDTARDLVPVSATMVRDQPMTYWDYLPECVRSRYVRKVCIIGPESTGKSTLARQLATHYGTVQAAEYARGCIDAHQGRLDAGMFPLFVRGQAASEQALARQANRLLFCDTDAFTTALYHELYIGGRPASIMEEADRRRYDLYLLTDPDGTPYTSDSQRLQPNRRQWFFDECLQRLQHRGETFVILRGGWEQRFRQACDAVDALLRELTT